MGEGISGGRSPEAKALRRIAVAAERIADALEKLVAQDPLSMIEEAIREEEGRVEVAPPEEGVPLPDNLLAHIPESERWRFQ